MKTFLLTLSLFSGTFLIAQTSLEPGHFQLNNFNSIENEVNKQEEKKTTPEIKKIRYEDHLIEAQSFNIPVIESNEHMDSLVVENKLIPIPEVGEGYKIQKLTHSRAFLNEPAYYLLKEIAISFYKETGKELSISSLTRTIESQNKLRRVNSNAAKGNSAHNYGASFDISYNKYNDKVGRNYALESMTESILNELVSQGKIYYIKERSQPCFHVTIRNSNLNLDEISTKE